MISCNFIDGFVAKHQALFRQVRSLVYAIVPYLLGLLDHKPYAARIAVFALFIIPVLFLVRRRMGRDPYWIGRLVMVFALTPILTVTIMGVLGFYLILNNFPIDGVGLNMGSSEDLWHYGRIVLALMVNCSLFHAVDLAASSDRD